MHRTFKLMPTSRTFTDEELIAGLRRFAANTRRHSFTCAEFERWKPRPFNPMTIINRFGSWREGMRAAGLEARSARHDPELLVREMERICRELGRPPSITELARRGRFGISAYYRCWGSPSRLCKLIAEHHAGALSREDLL